MSDKRVERLVSTRQRQRDAAGARCAEAQADLQRLQHSKDELLDDCRTQLGAAVGRGALGVCDLERMDIARRAVDLAEGAIAARLVDARCEAQASHRRLRQVEVLRDRRRQRALAKRARREQQALDESASRRQPSRGQGSLWTLALLVCLASLPQAGCADAAAEGAASADKQDKQDKQEKPATAKDSSKTDQADKNADKPADTTTDVTKSKGKGAEGGEQGEEEKLLLLKLRARREVLRTREQAIIAEKAELARLRKQADNTLSELERRAGIAAKQPAQQPKTAPAVKQPPEPRDHLGPVLKVMKPRAAAAMMAQMDPKIAAGILQRSFAPNEVAAVLAKMTPAKAAKIGAMLLHPRTTGGVRSVKRARRASNRKQGGE